MLWDSIPKPWLDILIDCKTLIDQIDGLISKAQEAGVRVVPDLDQVFAALTVAPTNVSVIIIGQDPYPSIGHANGLAFAVPSDTRPLPASLRNIFKEVASDTGSDSEADSSLKHWVDQGVLLLNTSLTTQADVRAAHAKWPWGEVVSTVLKHVVDINPKVAVVLWGNHAKQFSDLFDTNSVVTSAHPSPLSARQGFFGSKPFTKINRILEANHKQVIVW